VAGIRARLVDAIIPRAGWPPTARAIEAIRNVATYALGAGTASLDLERSGEARLLRELARHWRGRDPTIVDVGAHAGEWAACARAAFGPGATLQCFEPHPETFALLKRRMGGDPRASCHRLALGDETGPASLYSEAASSAFTSLHRGVFSAPGHEVTRVDEVEVRPLDAVAEELGLARIDLLKVDVEGHELPVLKGARRLLEAGSIECVQFEFGERDIASRTFLRDFYELLGPAFEIFRLTPYGLRRLEYSTAAEIFVLEANYFARRR
jgi:FkbM family methyltransferase